MSKHQTYTASFCKKSAVFTLFAILLLILSPQINAKVKCPSQPDKKLTWEQYCNKYSEEARRQMKTYGIPASITLAQGMYESAYGSSYLAVVGNNHFGIKAYRMKQLGWEGDILKCDDDNIDDPFCSFRSVPESYEWHSRFLLGNSRYAKLFKLDANDYRGWAYGLQECGYATNKKYGETIVEIIERYHLDTYDVYDGKYAYNLVPHIKYMTAAKGGLPYTRCLSNDDLTSIAKEFNVKVSALRYWNDLDKDVKLKEGDIIYLHKKHKRAAKTHPTHTVVPGDSLWNIAQRYGVTVHSLVSRNKLVTGQLQAGQVLKLR